MMRAVLAATLIVALSGCALQPPVSRAPATATQRAAWVARGLALEQLSTFDLSGRVASGALGFKADLRWKQLADGRFELRLAGPFGARAAELSGDDDSVRVRTGSNEPEISTDPELWLEQALGCRLPVRGLRWWARGLPSPESDNAVELDADGRASRIVQNGWDLSFVSYVMVGDYDLPRRIEARNGDTRVLLLVDRWGAAPPATPASDS